MDSNHRGAFVRKLKLGANGRGTGENQEENAAFDNRLQIREVVVEKRVRHLNANRKSRCKDDYVVNGRIQRMCLEQRGRGDSTLVERIEASS